MRGSMCELCVKGLSQTRNRIMTRMYSSTKLTNHEIRQKRNELFENEQKRQKAFIKRVEKIEVQYKGQPKDVTLMMNKDLSTPYNCALHIGDIVARRSVVAKVNGKLWDMHRPLKDPCELELLHMLDENPIDQNDVFWRTCSFVLGYVLENSFKDDVNVQLCAFPTPNVHRGSFVHDVNLNLPNWKPTYMELNALSLEAMTLPAKNLEFELLEVDKELAIEMFEDNPYKTEQIPGIAARNTQDRISVYRMGDHVDVTKGPLIANTNQIGRFNITNMYDIETEKYGPLKRVQGMGMPSDIDIHSSIYEFLCKKARRKNNEGEHLYRKRHRKTTQQNELKSAAS